MKNKLALFILIAFFQTGYSQLQVGDPAPELTLSDINGNSWNLQTLISEGKTVYFFFEDLNVGYSFNHAADTSKNNFYLQHGPLGLNDAMLFFMESNTTNTLDDIYGLTTESYGDATSVCEYPIIDCDSSTLALFNVTYSGLTCGFVAISPLGFVCTSINDCVTTYNINYTHHLSLLQHEGLNACIYIEMRIENCTTTNAIAHITNLGTLPVTHFDYTMTVGDSISTFSFDGLLPPFHSNYPLYDTVPVESDDALIVANILTEDVFPNDNTDEVLHHIPSTTNHFKIYIENTSQTTLFSQFNCQPTNDISTIFFNSNEEIPEGESLALDFYTNEIGCTIINWNIGSYFGATYSLSIKQVNADGSETALDYTPSNEVLANNPYLFVYVAELLPFNLSGKVFNDLNANTNQNLDELGIGNIEVHLGDLVTFTDAEGVYNFPNVNIQEYSEVSIVYNSSLWPICSTGSTIPLSELTYGQINFGLNAAAPIYNVEIQLEDPWYTCGYLGTMILSIENTGNIGASGAVYAALDSLLQYNFAFPPPLSLENDSIIWEYQNLYPGELAYFYVHFAAPDFQYIGSTITTAATVTATDVEGTVMGTFNTSADGILLCSYDPNDKHGFPAGTTEAHYIQNGTALEYLVRFQNTGNYQALNIRVDDQLDTDLDFSTFEFVGSSHACVPVFNSSTGMISFYFDDINLPDSTSNEVGSHGWLKYRISPQNNLEEMTTIDNTAYIYFDFNPAVITNTYTHTVSDLYFGIEDESVNSFSIYPNPVSNRLTIGNLDRWATGTLQILSMDGQIIENQFIPNTKQLTLDVSSFPSGVYMLRLSSQDGKMEMNKRFVVIR